jgi:UDP-N-acetylglucosamine 2-epimerase (non-hydrolysing)
MKVLTVVGTRPEIIKLGRVIPELDKYTKHVLVHTGQNYDFELNEVFFRDLEIRKPDHFLNAVGGSVAETIGNIISKTDAVLEVEKPDAFLIYGDTNSCLSIIAAKRRKIPVFHMEAGNRCFDQRVPEEINRKIVDHLSDINMVLTEHARRYLIAEGIRPETIIKTGSSMKELLTHFLPKIDSATPLERLKLNRGDYFVVSAHREENVDSTENLHALLNALNGLALHFGQRLIVSTHPRTKDRLDRLAPQGLHKLIEFHKPFSFFDYIALQKNARCVLSDSGTITEESSILGFPAIMLRNAHERPEGMDVGALIMSGLGLESIIDSIHTVTGQLAQHKAPPGIVPDYDVSLVSQQVVRIIKSYTGYINQTVWRKYP